VKLFCFHAGEREDPCLRMGPEFGRISFSWRVTAAFSLLLFKDSTLLYCSIAATGVVFTLSIIILRAYFWTLSRVARALCKKLLHKSYDIIAFINRDGAMLENLF
jgi:hypothetical protein